MNSVSEIIRIKKILKKAEKTQKELVFKCGVCRKEYSGYKCNECGNAPME